MENDVWAKCLDCGAELKQEDELCPKCGSTNKAYTSNAYDAMGINVIAKAKHTSLGAKRPDMEMVIHHFKKDGDPNLKNGVRENIKVDRVRDTYDHVVKDAKTGKVLHEEHEALSQHKSKNKKQNK